MGSENTSRYQQIINTSTTMFKSAFITFFTLLPLLTYVSAANETAPDIPGVWDPEYPNNRCIDYCAFLRPGQICPKAPRDIECLCTVYNIRMPAVPSPFTRTNIVSTMLGSEERHDWK